MTGGIGMYDFPQDEKALKKRISSYRSSMLKEKKKFGQVDDGAGKRYVLFSLYFVLNDLDAAREYIEWYEDEFADDVGEPIQKLFWSLILKKLGKDQEARRMLAETMLSNLYLIPKILNEDIAEYDIWHSSNFEHIGYVEYMPAEARAAITESEVLWIRQAFDSPDFALIRKRSIEIRQALRTAKGVEERGRLLDESHSLLDTLGT
jgi:hypothetical protein